MINKLKTYLLNIRKLSVFIPIAILSPAFLLNPNPSLLVMMAITGCYTYMCFTGPIYFMKYVVDKIDIPKKLNDICYVILYITLISFTIINWTYMFMSGEYGIYMNIFLIPFLGLLMSLKLVLIIIAPIAIVKLSNKFLIKGD